MRDDPIQDEKRLKRMPPRYFLCFVVAALFVGLSVFAPPVRAQQGNAAPPPPPPPTEGSEPDERPGLLTGNRGSVPATARAARRRRQPGGRPRSSSRDTATAETRNRDARSQITSRSKRQRQIRPPKRRPIPSFNWILCRRALLAGLLVGGACAFLGVYVVLRRIVFVGVAH